MEFNKLKKYLKLVFKDKFLITYGMIVALIVSAGMYTEVHAKTTVNDETIYERMLAENGDKVINLKLGVIRYYGDFGMVAYAETTAAEEDRLKNISMAINHGTITNRGQYGMYAEADAEAYDLGHATATTIITNHGTIVNRGHFGMGVETNAEAYNGGHTTATTTATNHGTIKNKGDFGLGVETYTEARDYGHATATTTSANYGTIKNYGDYGMYAGAGTYGGGNATATTIITNHGTIENKGNYGMGAYIGQYSYGDATATAINYGAIKNEGYYRMAAMGEGAETINRGRLDTRGDNYIVMKASYGGIIINEGTIDINEGHKDGTAMYAVSGATAINEKNGTINLNGHDGIGMVAKGAGSTIENRGKIYLSGSMVTPSENNQEDWVTTPGFNGEDNKGNRGMVIGDGAKMINKGKIIFGD